MIPKACIRRSRKHQGASFWPSAPVGGAALRTTYRASWRRHSRLQQCNSSSIASSGGKQVESRAGDGSVGRPPAPPSAPAGSRPKVELATQDEDTIASVITGPSVGAVAIIRISGSDALAIARRTFRPGGKFKFDWAPQSHRAYYGTAVDGDENVIDEVLCLAMLSPSSYTREDVVELHCHGGATCVQRLLRACYEAGARPARPGEFTLRAFLNGRLDLSQAESVLQLINARTPAAADSALAGLQGGLGSTISGLRGQLLALVAELEARLDFDEDMPEMDVAGVRGSVEEVQRGIEAALRTARQGSLLRSGLQVAIVGRPNVGKSSLLNAWSKSNRAIVTDIAGTTRDVLEASLVVGGVPLTLLDTAGIWESNDVVEKMGMERSAAAAAEADLVIMVVDGRAGWTDGDGAMFKTLWGSGRGSASCKVRGEALLVINKVDLAQGGETKVPLPAVPLDTFGGRVIRTSAKTRDGLDALDAAVLELAGAPQLAGGGMSWCINERQADALIRAHEALMRAGESVAAGLPFDFWTIDLRSAVLALGEVSGEEVTEEILNSIFSRFCLGK